jgi:hypothetical protein
VRIESAFLRARVLLGRAFAVRAEAPQRIKEALKVARQLDKEGAGWASAFAETVRALAALAQGDRAACEAGLERAERAFAACDMALFAAVARLRRGQANSGPAGAAWSMDARMTMREQAIADPDAIAGMLCPWPT